ncbi:uncharacterized protein LOC132275470 isoform X2 [Cornus florida]|uniref:uncharacterized protein LOC132275470 isoform X2 n=1 Tax=Cornus florida TaxID=4283 RepID=UPI0028A2BB0C|nr:uncharacterized protein LOC132275470 isoform X2 [Cornus florida]
MEVVAVKTMFVHLGLCPKKILTKRQTVGVLIPTFSSKRACFSLQMRGTAKDFRQMASHKYFHAVRAVSSGLEDIAVSSFTQFEDFSVSTSTTKADELKITVVVSGAKTRAIFDNVFSKMVADAQPIPGFRRVKGGKTPNEGITVGKDLRVGQSFEDLEAMFEPGNEFSFDAVVRRQ